MCKLDCFIVLVCFLVDPNHFFECVFIRRFQLGDLDGYRRGHDDGWYIGLRTVS